MANHFFLVAIPVYQMTRFHSFVKLSFQNLSNRPSHLSQKMLNPRTSLSSSRPPSADVVPRYSKPSGSIAHVPAAKSLETQKTQACHVQALNLKVNDDRPGTVRGFLHVPQRPQQHPTATILLSGALGGLVGPSSVYLSIADKIASLISGIPVLRLDYRYPARNKYCVTDVRGAVQYLEDNYVVSRFVLVGWSFGGAPVFTLGGSEKRVVACATVASQSAETKGIQAMAPKPILLLHGTSDRTLSPYCSEKLYADYGSRGARDLKLFEGDDHALTKHAAEAEEFICDFILKNASVEAHGVDRDIIEKELVHGEERNNLMKEGGDLGGRENLE